MEKDTLRSPALSFFSRPPFSYGIASGTEFANNVARVEDCFRIDQALRVYKHRVQLLS
jgi:hypothetical protein